MYKNYKAPALAMATALTTLGGAACAQSTVTVFGVADAAVRTLRNTGTGSLTSVASGGNSSSRFGFRGQENMGGGLSASFWLESQVNVDAGTSLATFWNRRSTVSLTQASLGEVRLGRDFVPTHLSWARFDPFAYVGIGAVTNFLTAANVGPIRSGYGTGNNAVARASNSVQYYLPRDFYGFEGNLMVATREGGNAAADQNKLYGGRIGYTYGKLFVSGATVRVRNDVTAAQTFKDSALGASLDLPVVRLSGGIRRFEIGSARQTNLLVAAVLPLGSSDIKLSWNRATLGGSVGATGIGNDKADQFALGYVYSFSKRTVLYSTIALIDNKGSSRFVVAGSPTGVAGGTSRGIEAGIRHDF